MIAQFKVPVTKNRQLTAYEAEIQYEDGGYESEITANTHNSEHTYVFNAETEFDTNASVNSNGEIEGNPPNELTVKAGILRKKQRALPKSSAMSAGAPAKMLANKQLIVKNSDGTTHSYMTL